MLGGDFLAFVEGQQRTGVVRAVAGVGLLTGVEELVLLMGEGLIACGFRSIKEEKGGRRVRYSSEESAGVHCEQQHQHQCAVDSRGRVHAGPSFRARGRVKWTVVPLPKSLSTQIRPPCASTTFLASASPRPLPAKVFFAYARPWYKRSKICGKSSGRIPGPVSATDTWITPALTSGCRRSFTVAPSGLNLRAFENRLSRTCSIRAPSADTHTRSDGASVRI